MAPGLQRNTLSLLIHNKSPEALIDRQDYY